VNGVEKSLGEVCKIINYKPIKIENSKNEGSYPFYNCSILGHLYSDNYQYDDDVLIMNKVNGSGKCKIYHNNGKFSIGSNLIIFKTDNNKFYYWILNAFCDIISQKFKGGDKKALNLSDFKKIKFSIPTPEDQQKVVTMIEEIEKEESEFNKSLAGIKKMIEYAYINVEMKCSSITSNCSKQENEDDISTSSKSSTKSKTYKISGVKCVKKANDYYDVETDKLFAITNDLGEVELIEEEEEYSYITIGKKDYILIDKDIYTIIDDKPDELYGFYDNNKFTKTTSNKIVVKARPKEKDLDELEAELNA